MSDPFLLPLPAITEKPGCSFKRPPLNGDLTIPELYDWHLQHNPSHHVFVYEYGDRLEYLPFSVVVPAAHRAAQLFTSLVSVDGESSMPTIAILADTNTATYFVSVLGLLYADIPVLPISPRNTPEAIAHIMDLAKVKFLFVAGPRYIQDLTTDTMRYFSKDLPPQILNMPTFHDLFSEQRNGNHLKDFFRKNTKDLNKTTQQRLKGSSSLPKVIPWTHITLLQVAMTPYLGAFDLRGEIFAAHAIPMYHAIGLNYIPWVAATGYVMAIFSPFSPRQQPSPENVLEGIRKSHASFILCVPSFVEAWSKNDHAIDILKTMRAIAYGGGPLAKPIGDSLTKQGVKIVTAIGLTETGLISAIFSDCQNDWDFFAMNPHCNAEFVPQGDGLYELVVVKSPTQVLEIANSSFRGVPSYQTGDLLIRHPTKAGCWKVYGRIDEQITLSTGLKVNPAPLEAVLGQHSRIKAAIMFGRARPQVGVLIFPDDTIGANSEQSPEDFEHIIKTQLTIMNALAPNHARIFMEAVVIAAADKPALWTGKGTVRRKATLEEYRDEIEAMYTRIDSYAFTPNGVQAPLITWTLQSTKLRVKEIVTSVLPGVSDDNGDLFANGCDSLQASRIRRIIQQTLVGDVRTTTSRLPQSLVYNFPSINALSMCITDLMQFDKLGTAPGDNTNARHDDMNLVASELLNSLAISQINNTQPYSSQRVDRGLDIILVTGTTGTLGAHLLSALVASEGVSIVYALNRPSRNGATSLSRQQDSLVSQGSDVSIASSSKVIYVEASLEDGEESIDNTLLAKLRHTVTHIIHAAWPIDFNCGISFFEPALKGLTTLIRLALSCNSPPRMIFVSSIGAYHSGAVNKSVQSPLSENFSDDSNLAADNGYGQSKWVAEKILTSVARNSGLHSVIIRLGQITPSSSRSLWKTTEWLPLLIKTSISLKLLPATPGVLSWLPVDIAANTILDLRNASGIVFNVVHPQPIPCGDIFGRLASDLQLPLQPYSIWLDALHTEEDSRFDDFFDLPALRLLGFFDSLRPVNHEIDINGAKNEQEAFGIVAAVRTLSVENSYSLRTARCLSADDASAWLARWKEIGFI